MTDLLPVTLAGETLHLLPERALFWPRMGALLLADLHLGKAATFRAAGLAVPEGGTAADLARLGVALDRSGATRLIVLGDLLHARTGRSPAVLDAVAAWRAPRSELDITLVRGNHDRGAGDPPASWGFTCADEPLALGPFLLCHHPQENPTGYVLAGHLHPLVELRGAGRQRERLPCFWFSQRVGLLPAFGSFTGGALVRPAPGDQVIVLAGDTLVRVQ